MKTKNWGRVLGMSLFLVGVVFGMLLFGGAAWADLESTFYGFDELGGGNLNTMDCPILMTSTEVGRVAATFDNPNDIPIQYMVRADISSRGLFRTERSMLSLEGHKSKKIYWNVTSEDIDLRNFIFAQISNYPGQKVPVRQATCGVIVINLPQFTGNQVFTFGMVVILVGILGGLVIWEAYGQPVTGKLPEISRAMKTLGLFVLLGLLFSFLGYWVLSVLLFAASVLAIGVILGFVLS